MVRRALIAVLAVVASVPTFVLGASSLAAALGFAPAALSLQLSSEFAPLGTPVTVSARVTPGSAGLPMPTGSVQFMVDGDPVASAVVLRDGRASLVLPTLAVGAHRVSASYTGDVSFAATPAGPPARLVVVPAGTSRFVPLQPARLLDTRPGPDQVGYAGDKPGDGATLALQVTGRGGVPSEGVTAVAMNVTMTQTVAVGFVTAYPSDTPRPLASNVNSEFADQTIPNLAIVPVSAAGTISLYGLRSTHLVVDVQGYFTSTLASSSGRLVPLAPSRLLDTRPNGPQVGYVGAKPNDGATVTLQVAGRGGVPAAGAGGVVLNVTATNAGADAGFVTVYPADRPQPLASNLNITRVGQTIPNAVWVPLSGGGAVNLYVLRSTDLVVDVAGWFTTEDAPAAASGLFVPVQPSRVLDTRPGGPQVGYTGARPATGAVVPIGGVPGAQATALALVANVTATEAAGPGFVTAIPEGSALPLASNLNLESAGQTRPNLVMSATGPGGRVGLYVNGGTHLVADLAGFFISDPDPLPPVIKRDSMAPAANTVVLEASAVRTVTGDATAGYVLTFPPGSPGPAVGSGLVLKAGGAAYPTGLAGTVTERTVNADGTSTLRVAQAPIDQLVDSLDISYDGPADLVATSDAPGQAAGPAVAPSLHPSEAGGATATFDKTKTIFDRSAFECTVSGGVVLTAAVLRFENTRVHFEKRVSLTTAPFVQFYIQTEPIVEFAGEIQGGVKCSLTEEFRKSHRIVWTLPIEVPTTVDLAPAFEIEANVSGGVSVREHFYRMVGFVTQPDLSIRTYNAASRTTEAVDLKGQVAASLLVGADLSVKIGDVAGIGITLGPKFTASVDIHLCRKLDVGISAAFDLRLELWNKRFKTDFLSFTLGPWVLYQRCPDDGPAGGALGITTAVLPSATVGEGYGYSMSAQGGQPPYRWSAANLPPWASLRSDGTLEGVPTSVEQRSISVTLSDAKGATITRLLTLSVADPVLPPPPPPPALPVSFNRLSGPSGMSLRAVGTCPVATAPVGTAEFQVHFRFDGRRVSVSQYLNGSSLPTSTGAFSILFYFYENVGHHQLTAECWARVTGSSSFDTYVTSSVSDFLVTDPTEPFEVSGTFVEGTQVTTSGKCPLGWPTYEALAFSWSGSFAIVAGTFEASVRPGGDWGPHSFTVPVKHDGFNSFYVQNTCYGGSGDSDRVFVPLVGGNIQSPP